MGWDLHSWKSKKRKGPCTQEAPLLAGRSGSWTERELQRLQGEPNNQSATGRTERTMQRGLIPVPCMLQPEIHIRWYRQAGTQGLEDKPRETTAAGCAETAWRDKSALRLQPSWVGGAGHVFAEVQTRHRSTVLLLRGVWWEGRGCL